MKVSRAEIRKYLDLPWTYKVVTDVDRGRKIYIVEVVELPYVCTHGYTFRSAMKNIREAMYGVISLSLELGNDIPVPASEQTESVYHVPYSAIEPLFAS